MFTFPSCDDTPNFMEERFIHQGVEYVIRSLPFNDGWRAAAFVNNVRISPMFTISHEDDLDCAFFSGERGLESLFRIIKAQIIEGRISPN